MFINGIIPAKQLCAQIVLSVMDLKFTAGSNENSYKRSTEAGKPRNGDALEWLHLTVLLLTQRGSFPRLLQLVGPAETTSISSAPSPRLLLTHEQVLFLSTHYNCTTSVRSYYSLIVY